MNRISWKPTESRALRATAGLVLVLLMSLVLAACGDATATTAPPTTTAPATTSAATTTTTAPTTDNNATSTPVTLPSVTAAPSPAPATTSATSTTSVASAQTTSAPRGTVVTQGVPRFEEAKCPFKLAADQKEGQTARCGYVIVPELHSQPNNGKTIKLATIIYKSLSNNPAPEPIVFLQGGPGGGSQDFVENLITGAFYKAYAANNDLILFDQRGTGFSEPSLNCTEYTDAQLQAYSQPLSQADEDKSLNDALFKCHDRLVGQNVNLDAYNSAENAADVNDLRIALGYAKLNLNGASYGSRLGLEVMRDFPQAVRSSLLDSLVPPQVDLYKDEPVSFDRSFNLLFDKCAADADCSRAYPDLKGTFSKAVAQLNSKPATVKVTDPNTKKSYNVVVTGNRFTSALQLLFYSTEVLPLIPSLINQVQQGNNAALVLPMTLVLFYSDVAYGMYFSVQCSEETPFNKPADVQASTQNVLPELKALYSSSVSIFSICQRWGVKSAPARENEPIKSDLPTLVFAGQFDPITPPAYAQTTVKTLTNAYYVEVPDGAHGSSISTRQCEINIVTSFYANPTKQPDSSCVSRQTIKFTIAPGTGAGSAPSSTTAAATGTSPAATTAAASGQSDIPVYPGATEISLGATLEKQLGQALAGNLNSTQYLGLVTQDEPAKVIEYYSKQLGDQGYSTQPALRQSTTQGSAKVEVAGFIKNSSILVVSSQGPLDDTTVSALSLQAPELAQKLKAGDTLVIIILGSRK